MIDSADRPVPVPVPHEAAQPEKAGPARRRLGLWLASGIAMLFTAVLLSIAVFLFLGVEGHPAVGAFARERIVAALQERLDPRLALTIDKVELSRGSKGTVVRIEGFTIRDERGRALVAAPSGSVTLDTGALLLMRLNPTQVILDGLSAAVEVSEGGDISVAPATQAEIPPQQEAASASATPPLERFQQMIGAAFAGIAATRDSIGGRLPSIGIDAANLRVLDRRSGQRYAFSNISSRMFSKADGSAQATLELKTGRAPWQAALDMSPRTPQGQTFTARSENLTLGDVLGLAGASTDAVNPAAPVAVTVTAEVDGSLRGRSARAVIALGSTTLLADLPKNEHLKFDRAEAVLVWDHGSPRVRVESLTGSAGPTQVEMAGEVLPPEAPDAPWQVRLAGKDVRVQGLAPDDAPILLSEVRLEGEAFPEAGIYRLRQGVAQGPNVRVTAEAGTVIGADGRPTLALDLAASDTDARAALRLWPAFAAAGVRKWLADHLQAGHANQIRVKLDFSADVLEDAMHSRPLPDQAMAVTWHVSRALLAPLADMPPVRDLVGSGSARGRTVRLDLSNGVMEMGGGRKITVPEGSFAIADVAQDPPDARLRLRFSGGADAVADLVASPGIQKYSPLPVAPGTLKGSIEGEVSIGLRLSETMRPGDVRVGINAQLKGMTIDKAVAGETIEAGNFTLNVDRQNVVMKGDAKVFGTPAQIEVKALPKQKPRATISMTLDDATRSRRGLSLGGVVTGPVGVKFATDIDGPDDRDIAVEFDATRAKIDGLVPGWSKPAGQAARGKVTVGKLDNGGWDLDDIEFDAGALSMRGSALVSADGQLTKAQLPVFKLSQGDNARLEVERSGNLVKLTVRGNSIDARPFLRSLQTGAIDKSGARDAELNLKSVALAGFNSEIIANADLKLAFRGGDMRRFDLSGVFDGKPVTTKLTPRPGSQPLLTVDSEDAGAFLRFFDVYSRMRGGRLTLGATLGGTQRGSILIRDFVLRNEPAMKRLVANPSASTAGIDGARLDPAFVQRMTANQDVGFTKMTIEFQRNASRLDLRDAVIWGPEIGGSMEGYLDYGRDRVDLTGTFVPAYSLNNFFAQVPIVGPLLGGGRNEGLFAVRYSIIGRVSAPTLTINPLTVIAPGFLRKLIDFRASPGQAAPRPSPGSGDR